MGMVHVPVKLYGAVDEKTSIRFNSIHRDCGSRIEAPRWCPNCDRKVERTELVKGYHLGDDNYVLMEEADFMGLPVASAKVIEITEVVEANVIDPVWPSKPYLLAVDKKEKVGLKPFALILEALRQTDKVVLGKIAMREREHVVALRPYGKVLLLQTLHYADEIRDVGEVEQDLPAVSDAELDLANILLDSIAGVGDLSAYEDTYRNALEERIDAKAAGQPFTVAADTKEEAATDDVMASLKASIEQVKQGKEAAPVDPVTLKGALAQIDESSFACPVEGCEFEAYSKEALEGHVGHAHPDYVPSA